MYFRKLLKRGIGFNAPSVHVGYCIKYIEKTVVPKNCINTLNLPFFIFIYFLFLLAVDLIMLFISVASWFHAVFSWQDHTQRFLT